MGGGGSKSVEMVKSENFKQSMLTDESFSIFNFHSLSGFGELPWFSVCWGWPAWAMPSPVSRTDGERWQGGRPQQSRFSRHPHRMDGTGRELREMQEYQ